MKMPGNKTLFGLSVLAGIGFVLLSAAYSRFSLSRLPEVTTHQLTHSIFVTEQVSVNAVTSLKHDGITTIIDMRPDGEAAGQPTAAAMAAAAKAEGLDFAYIPVPHGPIPDTAVTALQQQLAKNSGAVLLYCRSGSRAARTWSLVEASRNGGLDAPDILAAVKASKLNADDLEPAIRQRIALRTADSKGTP
ncbi:beta-lactamase hydrolase domain-containing protein [Undibacterium sp. TJN19]|uniref:beta-lactamase hydrolase domain-containing protein n=1 Tax=Undibacterium sp. TJN19 TaxID=3413055 RepID=UPI003BEF83EA